MDDQVPLIVPEVNGEEAVRHQGIISNPNCSTILFVVAIHPIHIIARIRRAIVCTYQAVSGAGARGVESLIRESRDPGKRDPESVFPHPIADNLIPEVGGVNESGDTEEEVKMERETRKILADPDLRVSSTCVRVPVSRAHSEAIHLELERPLSRAEAREAMEKAKGVELLDDPSSHLYPTPQRASGAWFRSSRWMTGLATLVIAAAVLVAGILITGNLYVALVSQDLRISSASS